MTSVLLVNVHGFGGFLYRNLKGRETTMSVRNVNLHPEQDTLLRLPQVLAIVPVGRATWWNGIKDGRFPPGVKLGPRTTCWRKSDIEKLIASLA